MINNDIDFVKQIFLFFNKRDYTENELRFYIDALAVKYPVDWNKFFHEIVKTSEKRVLPMPKYFVDKLPEFKKISAASCANEGCVIRVYYDTTPSKDDKNKTPRMPYCDFTVSNNEGIQSINNIKKRAESVDDNGIKHTSIKKIVQYPKGTTLIGDSVFFNIRVSESLPPEEQIKRTILKEREMKEQIKVLFQREGEE